VLVFARLAFPFFLLVLVLAEIGDATNRRCGIRCDLDQIHPALLRQGQRLLNRDDSHLLPIRVDDPNFPRADLVIYTNKLLNIANLRL
jgi:hypothetical protein